MKLFSEQIETGLPQNAEKPADALDLLRCARCGRDLVAEVVLAGDAACPYCGNLFRQPGVSLKSNGKPTRAIRSRFRATAPNWKKSA